SLRRWSLALRRCAPPNAANRTTTPSSMPLLSELSLSLSLSLSPTLSPSLVPVLLSPPPCAICPVPSCLPWSSHFLSLYLSLSLSLSVSLSPKYDHKLPLCPPPDQMHS